MKILIILISIITFTNLNVGQDFEDKLKLSYEEYALIEEYSNNYYDLQLYAGKLKNEVYYAIYFRNIIPSQYNLKLSYNNKIYKLDADARGDILASAIKLKNVEEFSIFIYNKENFYQYGMNNFKNIKPLHIDDFSTLTNKVIGDGNGVTPTKVKMEFNISNKLIIYVVLSSVFLSCGLIIFYYYKRNKGMFDSDIKSANVFNFKEFIKSVNQDQVYDEGFEIDDFTNIFEDEEKDHVFVDQEKETKDSLITKTYIWHHYEEETSDFDIKKHLSSLGLEINYSTASVDEKNKVMLELMRLRDQKEITQDDYLDEISKLWKE